VLVPAAAAAAWRQPPLGCRDCCEGVLPGVWSSWCGGCCVYRVWGFGVHSKQGFGVHRVWMCVVQSVGVWCAHTPPIGCSGVTTSSSSSRASSIPASSCFGIWHDCERAADSVGVLRCAALGVWDRNGPCYCTCLAQQGLWVVDQG
jgi:hypothetical protein